MISDIKSLVQHSIDKIQKWSQKYIKNSQINNDPSNLIANKWEETNEEAKVNKKVSPFHKAQKHQYSIKKAEFIKPIHLEVNKKCKEESPIIHKDIMWDEWSQIPIIGARYVCLICENYDLCEKWEFNYHHKHPLLKVKNPEEFRKFLDYCNKRKINIS